MSFSFLQWFVVAVSKRGTWACRLLTNVQDEQWEMAWNEVWPFPRGHVTSCQHPQIAPDVSRTDAMKHITNWIQASPRGWWWQGRTLRAYHVPANWVRIWKDFFFFLNKLTRPKIPEFCEAVGFHLRLNLNRGPCSPLQLHTISWSVHGYLSERIVSIKNVNRGHLAWDGSWWKEQRPPIYSKAGNSEWSLHPTKRCRVQQTVGSRVCGFFTGIISQHGLPLIC